jgi:hypothetical protein
VRGKPCPTGLVPESKKPIGEKEMSDTGISVSPDTLRAKFDEIAVIDEKLDSVSGGADSGKRALANQIASETSGSWKKVADNLVASLAKIEDPNDLTGAVTGLIKSVNDSFKESIDKYLTEQVEARKNDAPAVSDDEVAELSTSRKELVEQYKALRQILEMFGNDVSTIPEPKKRTGSRGKRGPRVLTNFSFSIDGKERTSSQNSLSSIANTVCADLNWKTADLKNWLAEQGLDFQNPEDSWEYTLPNGKVISGVVMEVDDDDVEDTETVDEEAIV